MHAMRRGHPCPALSYIPPVSASEADATTFVIVRQRTFTWPFCFYCISILSDRWQLLDFVLGKGQGMLHMIMF